jgi:hypothetical protein
VGTLLKLAFCTVFAVVFLACQGSSGNQDRTVLGEILDPEAYRPEIQALENDMYEPSFDANVRNAVAIKLDDLAEKVAQEDGAVTALYSIEMRQLALATQLGRDDAYIRENWERIRCGLFQDAVWYRWRNSPKRPQVASQIEMHGDDELEREYARMLGKLEDLVDRGKRDVERLGEPEERTTDYYNGDYQYLVEAWEDWAENWRGKLASIERDLPEQPTYQEDAALRFAHGNLSKAISYLYAVPVGRGQWETPFRNHWEKYFRLADEQIDKARFQIEK